MKISINEKGTLLVDGVEKKNANLNAKFLEEIVEDSLNNEVEYEINSDSPIGKFFKKIQEETAEGSDLRTSISEFKNKKATKQEEIDGLVSNYEKNQEV